MAGDPGGEGRGGEGREKYDIRISEGKCDCLALSMIAPDAAHSGMPIAGRNSASFEYSFRSACALLEP